MCYFCHAQLFEIAHAENIKSPLVQHSYRNAKVVEAFYDAGRHIVSICRRIHRRERRRYPIALAASQRPTSRDFVPWRFLVAGRISARSVPSFPATKNLHNKRLAA
jgi:hypothetical protein